MSLVVAYLYNPSCAYYFVLNGAGNGGSSGFGGKGNR